MGILIEVATFGIVCGHLGIPIVSLILVYNHQNA